MTPARQISLALVASLLFATSARAGTFANPFRSSRGDLTKNADLHASDCETWGSACQAACSAP
jgi:hypothetical protein